MKDELLDETELYPFAEDEKGVSFLVSYDYEIFLVVKVEISLRLRSVADDHRKLMCSLYRMPR